MENWGIIRMNIQTKVTVREFSFKLDKTGRKSLCSLSCDVLRMLMMQFLSYAQMEMVLGIWISIQYTFVDWLKTVWPYSYDKITSFIIYQL